MFPPSLDGLYCVDINIFFILLLVESLRLMPSDFLDTNKIGSGSISGRHAAVRIYRWHARHSLTVVDVEVYDRHLVDACVAVHTPRVSRADGLRRRKMVYMAMGKTVLGVSA